LKKNVSNQLNPNLTFKSFTCGETFHVYNSLLTIFGLKQGFPNRGEWTHPRGSWRVSTIAIVRLLKQKHTS